MRTFRVVFTLSLFLSISPTLTLTLSHSPSCSLFISLYLSLLLLDRTQRATATQQEQEQQQQQRGRPDFTPRAEYVRLEIEALAGVQLGDVSDVAGPRKFESASGRGPREGRAARRVRSPLDGRTQRVGLGQLAIGQTLPGSNPAAPSLWQQTHQQLAKGQTGSTLPIRTLSMGC